MYGTKKVKPYEVYLGVNWVENAWKNTGTQYKPTGKLSFVHSAIVAE